jgi:hypothetical protein
MKKSSTKKPGTIRKASPSAVKALTLEEQATAAMNLIAKSLDRMATALEDDNKVRTEQNEKTQRMIDELMPMVRKTLDGARHTYDGN